MGTHMDALNHLHKDGRTYNGHRVADITAPYGTTQLGVETLPQVVTRGAAGRRRRPPWRRPPRGR